MYSFIIHDIPPFLKGLSILAHFQNLKPVWLYCLNNSFHYLNSTTHISTTLFHPYVFLQHLNNVIRTMLSNGSLLSEMTEYLIKLVIGRTIYFPIYYNL